MAKNRKAKCFVGMAFGRTDVDRFFSRALRPTLDQLGVSTLVVNRREESNEDLNAQILKMMNQADFCVADLTYARPSVYFEAGYMQRHGELICTVRKDHLDGTQDDRRVHFDLRARPIIGWTENSFGSFQRKLTQRIRNTFLNKWNASVEKERALERQRTRFFRNSVVWQVRTVWHWAVGELLKAGVKEWRGNLDPVFGGVSERIYRDPRRASGVGACFAGGGAPHLYWTRLKKGVLHRGALVVIENPTLTKLRDSINSVAYSWGSRLQLYNEINLARVKSKRDLIIIVSPRPIPLERVKSLHSGARLEDDMTLSWFDRSSEVVEPGRHDGGEWIDEKRRSFRGAVSVVILPNIFVSEALESLVQEYVRPLL